MEKIPKALAIEWSHKYKQNSNQKLPSSNTKLKGSLYIYFSTSKKQISVIIVCLEGQKQENMP
jgi:hypothetical protein